MQATRATQVPQVAPEAAGVAAEAAAGALEQASLSRSTQPQVLRVVLVQYQALQTAMAGLPGLSAPLQLRLVGLGVQETLALRGLRVLRVMQVQAQIRVPLATRAVLALTARQVIQVIRA